MVNFYELVPAGTYTVGEVDSDGHLKSSDAITGSVANKIRINVYL